MLHLAQMGGNMIPLFISMLLLSSPQSQAQAGCQVLTSNGRVSTVQNDEFYRVISQEKSCPQNIDSVNVLLNRNFQNRKFLVANRGRNNPKMGSFSIFESFSGKTRAVDAGIFLGHFTHLKTLNGSKIIDLDQSPDKGKLVIELIAWDQSKGYYNFYELIGQGQYSQWFYRGDSKDILFDNQSIYLNDSPQKPPIGQTLRCSGCHTSGGPIMKEMAIPHNDWWINSRPLVFQHSQSDGFLQRIRTLDSAESLAAQVQSGIQKLENSVSYQNIKKSLGIRHQLRPLFCDLEINIESDLKPFSSSSAIQVPSNALAGSLAGAFRFLVPKSSYSGLLQKYKMQFPETSHVDADHAWLTPVKGYSDLVAIGKLKMIGLVDDKTIFDIFFSSPMGSIMNKDKCGLLKLVPQSMNWKPGFVLNLKNFIARGGVDLTVAKSMYFRLTSPSLNPAAYQKMINEWYQSLNQKISKGEIEPLFKQMLLNRSAVFESEISKNPRGQILEPGFRVIFPQPQSFPIGRMSN